MSAGVDDRPSQVPDPDRALGELHRVCAPGGCAGFTVWGRRAESPLFTLLEGVLKRLRDEGAIPAPAAAPAPAVPRRSQFHLGQDDPALRDRARAAGFVDVVSWHVPCAWPRGVGGARPAGRHFAESWLGSQLSSLELRATLTETQWGRVVDALAAAAQEIFDGGAPVLCDVVVVVARKPAAAPPEPPRSPPRTVSLSRLDSPSR